MSVDQQGPEIARKFFAETGVKALALYIDRSAQAAFKLGTPGLPATLLVDRSGREIGRHLGPANWDAPEIVAALRSRHGVSLYQMSGARQSGDRWAVAGTAPRG